MSLRQIAKQLGITPAYLSYMVNGKRPWRRDLFERYSYLVNTSVNIQSTDVNNIVRPNSIETTIQPSYVSAMAGAGGSRTPRRHRRVPTNGFEVREAHQSPSTPGIGVYSIATPPPNISKRGRLLEMISTVQSLGAS